MGGDTHCLYSNDSADISETMIPPPTSAKIPIVGTNPRK